MDLFFNELSIKEGPGKEAGKQWMEGLLAVYKKASKMGFKELKTTETFLTFPLATGYKMHDWLHDQTVDPESRLLVKTKVSKFPFIEQLVDNKNNQDSNLSEFRYKGRNAVGLGAAYLFESVSVSFSNADEWNNFLIELLITEVSEENEITEFTKNVKHSSKPEHLDSLIDWQKERKRLDIPNGKLLWLKRNEYLPYLILCSGVEKQISYLSGQEPAFHLSRKATSSK